MRKINIKGLQQQIDRTRFEIALYHLDRIGTIAAAAPLADKDTRVVRAVERCMAEALLQGSSPDVTA